MSRTEFMGCLERLLADLPYEERRDALNYYENYFEEAGPEREQEVIRELGSPREVADEILHGARGADEYADSQNIRGEYKGETASGSGRGKRSRWFWIALLAIPVVLIGLPLLIAAVSVLFGLLAAGLAVTVALFVGALIFALIAVVKLFAVPSVGLLMFGLTLVFVGGGILVAYGLIGFLRLIGSGIGWLGSVFRGSRA